MALGNRQFSVYERMDIATRLARKLNEMAHKKTTLQTSGNKGVVAYTKAIEEVLERPVQFLETELDNLKRLLDEHS